MVMMMMMLVMTTMMMLVMMMTETHRAFPPQYVYHLYSIIGLTTERWIFL
jgi:hypothetical protein